MNATKLLYRLCLLPCAAAALFACSTATPEKVNESHGESVKNMIVEQTYVEGEATPALDGDKARNVLRAYEQDVSNPQKVEQEVIRVKLD